MSPQARFRRGLLKCLYSWYCILGLSKKRQISTLGRHTHLFIAIRGNSSEFKTMTLQKVIHKQRPFSTYHLYPHNVHSIVLPILLLKKPKHPNRNSSFPSSNFAYSFSATIWTFYTVNLIWKCIYWRLSKDLLMHFFSLYQILLFLYM